MAYRLDHGEYPDSLAALVPDYLPFVPIDPYSGEPFEYRPNGLDLELRDYDLITVPAHTPLLWSVGARQARLRVKAVEEPDASEPAVDVTRKVYEFELAPSPYAYGTPLVFPLPGE